MSKDNALIDWRRLKTKTSVERDLLFCQSLGGGLASKAKTILKITTSASHFSNAR